MPRRATIHEILIASPADVAKERDVVGEVIQDWNSSHARASGVTLQPVRWELDTIPEFGTEPQSAINRQIVDGADFVIALFGLKLGAPTGVAASGTVEEIERLREAGKDVMVYFSTAPVPRNHNAEQLRLLNEYKDSLRNRGLYADFSDIEDLRRKLSRHLAKKMSVYTTQTVPQEMPRRQLEPARLLLSSPNGGRSGDVATRRLVAEIENISDVEMLKEYSVTMTVPKALLTFDSSQYASEIPSPDNAYRRFRMTEGSHRNAVIFPGDKMIVFSIELAIDQLRLKGTYLEGDVEAVLAAKITAIAITNGSRLTSEIAVSQIFPQR